MRIRYLSRFTGQRRAAMNLERTEDSASRFARFVEELTSVIGHADRERPLNDYCAGLLASEGRRSVEPIAAVTAPCEVPAQHQRLLHFVANASWSDAAVLGKVRELILPVIERHGPIEAWIVAATMERAASEYRMVFSHRDDVTLANPFGPTVRGVP